MDTMMYVDTRDLQRIHTALADMIRLHHDAYVAAHLRAARLAPRERELLMLDHRGLKRREIATHLVVDELTVEKYWCRIYAKTDVPTRHAVRAWVQALYADAAHHTEAHGMEGKMVVEQHATDEPRLGRAQRGRRLGAISLVVHRPVRVTRRRPSALRKPM